GSARRSPRHPPPVAGRADSLTRSESTSGGASAAPPDTPHRSPVATILSRALTPPLRECDGRFVARRENAGCVEPHATARTVDRSRPAPVSYVIMARERHVDALMRKLLHAIETSLSAAEAAREAVQEVLKRGAEAGIFFA